MRTLVIALATVLVGAAAMAQSIKDDGTSPASSTPPVAASDAVKPAALATVPATLSPVAPGIVAQDQQHRRMLLLMLMNGGGRTRPFGAMGAAGGR